MDSDDETLFNVNLASQSNHIPQETKPFLQSSLILLHRSLSLASHNDQVSSRRKPHRLSLWRLLLPVISLLWLVPIATLLAFNYKNRIIGATLCPRARCLDDIWSIHDNIFSDYAAESAKKLNRVDHNTLGALQLVAKALETWFVFIATSIIFDLSIILAKKGKGLPIGYFVTHLRFTDLSYLLDPSLWKCSIFNPNIDQFQHSKRLERVKFCAFTILVVFLTILMNLMGPAMAILVLPTLQYIDTPHLANETFIGHGAISPPGLSGRSEFLGCDADDFYTFNYSCTLSRYGPSLDNWATLAELSINQGWHYGSAMSQSQSQEGSVQFLLNATEPNIIPSTLWVSNRQALSSLSKRLDDRSDDSGVLENSLQLVYNRGGPAFALRATCSMVRVRTVELSKDKDVVCSYDNDSDSPTTAFGVQCFPRGTGWAMGNLQSQFFVQREPSANFSDFGRSALRVKNYFSPQLFRWQRGRKFFPCHDPSLKSCDWEKIFADSNNNPVVNVGITEYGLHGDHRYWCQNSVYLEFVTYSLDPWKDTNPTSLVTMRNPTMRNPISLVTLRNPTMRKPGEKIPMEPIVIDPNWLLAAWSVGLNEIVDGSRPSAQTLIRSIEILRQSAESDQEHPFNHKPLNHTLLDLFHSYSTSQALSMINYYSTVPPNISASTDHDPFQPVFHSWATRYIWAYGFSSRTSILGAVVGYAGAFCMFLRMALSVFGGTHRYDMSDLLVTALEYFPRSSDFRDRDTVQSRAQVRFRLKEDDDGRIVFASGQDLNTDKEEPADDEKSL